MHKIYPEILERICNQEKETALERGKPAKIFHILPDIYGYNKTMITETKKPLICRNGKGNEKSSCFGFRRTQNRTSRRV